ncbi:angiopoietin-2-like [Saccostrea echinata]|uniref:angiopoietin-2-like n=1 Tax=Saccostrea echinata TaxID=191078 RepID=UPI002A820BCD|nr:angiopoietin-2-like [Saccostrea echinata]
MVPDNGNEYDVPVGERVEKALSIPAPLNESSAMGQMAEGSDEGNTCMYEEIWEGEARARGAIPKNQNAQWKAVDSADESIPAPLNESSAMGQMAEGSDEGNTCMYEEIGEGEARARGAIPKKPNAKRKATKLKTGWNEKWHTTDRRVKDEYAEDRIPEAASIRDIPSCSREETGECYQRRKDKNRSVSNNANGNGALKEERVLQVQGAAAPLNGHLQNGRNNEHADDENVYENIWEEEVDNERVLRAEANAQQEIGHEVDNERVLREEANAQQEIGNVALEASCLDWIHEERYAGPVVLVMKIIGQKQCIKECQTRATLCKGISYKKENLQCEIVSSTEEMEPSSKYLRIKLDETVNDNVECLSCLPNEKCVFLSSEKTYCVNDNDKKGTKDCTEVQSLSSQSGLYRISIPVLGHVTAFCEMEADGGGWTVFQRRLDGSEDFYRTWAEYKDGFGNLTAEFWFGNEKLYLLLSQGIYELRMDMSDFNNQTRYVKYSSISLGNEASKYLMSLSGYSGDVADCFTATTNPIQNMKFSTKDQDNDVDGNNCATLYKSGWWHNKCHCSNPNGLYLAGDTTIFAEGITYNPWLTHYYSLKTIQLMVRRTV